MIGTSRRLLRRLGVTTHPALVGAEGCIARFSDGSTTEAATVVWATGFRTDHSFIDADLTRTAQRDPNLRFVGQPWQRSRGSALLGFVGADAADLARCIAADKGPVRAMPVPVG